jgi:hypothetical protein
MMPDTLVRETRWFVRFAAFQMILVGAAASQAFAQGPGGPNGVEIQIRAENRSTSDTPFCYVGGGMVGDKLKVDAFMDTAGVVTGTATFEDANGNVTDIELDRMFAFSICNPANCGGILVQNQANQNTVPIWFNDFFPGFVGSSAAQLNVELPRGCTNTKSTFTPGLDKVTMQIKFR